MDERNPDGFINEGNISSENQEPAAEETIAEAADQMKTEQEDINCGYQSTNENGQDSGENRQGTYNSGRDTDENRQGSYNSGQNNYESRQTAYGGQQSSYVRQQNSFNGRQGGDSGQWTGGYYTARENTGSPQGTKYGNTGNNNHTYSAPKQKRNKPMSTGKKWAMTVCAAVVFGLIAGAVMFGVNSLGNHLTQAGRVQSDTAVPEQEKPAGISEIENVIPSGEKAIADYSGSDSLASVEAVVEECMPSVVTIATVSVQEMQSWFGEPQQYEAEGGGTGVIVGQNDTELLIATNNHVVEGANSVSVGFIDETSVEAKVKGTDNDNDLAVIAVNLNDIPEETMLKIKIAKLGNSDDLKLGERVVVIGNSLGYGQSVTTGIVSALGRELSLNDGVNRFVSSDLIQTDAAINSGNSGGALLNMRGEVIGINEAKSSYTSNGATVDNVGYAIPISKAEPILQELMALTTRDKVAEDNAGYLGVTCKDITSDSDLVTVYGFPEGVCFLEVFEGGPCAAAGLQKGDVLTKFDGRTIDSFSELKNTLQYYSAGEQVELTILRQNDSSGEYEEKTVTVTLCDYSTLENIYSAG